jgi:hypothetical protein
MTNGKIIVGNFTVPVSMADKVPDVIADELSKPGLKINYQLVSSPDFKKIVCLLKTKSVFDGRNMYESGVTKVARQIYDGNGR